MPVGVAGELQTAPQTLPSFTASLLAQGPYSHTYHIGTILCREFQFGGSEVCSGLAKLAHTLSWSEMNVFPEELLQSQPSHPNLLPGISFCSVPGSSLSQFALNSVSIIITNTWVIHCFILFMSDHETTQPHKNHKAMSALDNFSCIQMVQG